MFLAFLWMARHEMDGANIAATLPPLARTCTRLTGSGTPTLLPTSMYPYLRFDSMTNCSSVQLLPASPDSTVPPVTIEQPNVVALAFSPLATQLFTFERPVKSETDVHKNVKVWDVKTGELVGGWYHKTGDDWWVGAGLRLSIADPSPGSRS